MLVFVKKIRLEKGISLSELAEKSGVSVSHIHNIESGFKNPTIKVLCKLAKALDVPCSELFSCD
ncbi:MAG: helix-turn-helix transcriptional regulator [Eubacterium sp.]|jgi:XRE family transcriptional regulator of biofilm formation|nr:helix-turn-helix transcriptional regulator [Eubacterium sp.]